MIYQTAEEAITRGISHDEIAFCINSEENREYLASESDDCIRSTGAMNFKQVK